MSAWSVRKPEATHVRGFCIKCGVNQQKKHSSGRYQALCSPCDKRRFNGKNYNNLYEKYKLKECNRCNFEAKHKCQLDVHHIDGNHHNNDPNNLETLCANCHRLEHFGKEKAPRNFEIPRGYSFEYFSGCKEVRTQLIPTIASVLFYFIWATLCEV